MRVQLIITTNREGFTPVPAANRSNLWKTLAKYRPLVLRTMFGPIEATLGWKFQAWTVRGCVLQTRDHQQVELTNSALFDLRRLACKSLTKPSKNEDQTILGITRHPDHVCVRLLVCCASGSYAEVNAFTKRDDEGFPVAIREEDLQPFTYEPAGLNFSAYMRDIEDIPGKLAEINEALAMAWAMEIG